MTGSHPRLVPDVLRARLSSQPDTLALVVDGCGSLTYQSWEERSNAIGRGLVHAGVCPGDRVGLMFDSRRWHAYAVAYFAVLKAGAVAVPIPAGTRDVQVRRILSHCEAMGVCGHPPLALGPLSVPVWDPADVGDGQRTDPFQVPTSADALAQILYTSGTTGRPKGVACSHENVLFGIVAGGAELERARLAHVALHAFPVGVNAGQLVLIRAAHRLATTVTVPGFAPERFAALVGEHHVTSLLLVPAMALTLLDAGVFERHDLSSVQVVRLTGAASPPSLLRRLAHVLPHVTITNDYALTESIPSAVSITYEPARPQALGVADAGVRVVDDDGQASPPGGVGEVWLSTPGAPQRSYYRDPVATAATFHAGWVRTGDLGYVDADGYLCLSDRADDHIVSGGFKVSSLEVEAVLHEHPSVAEAAVIGVPHPVLGAQVTAAIVLRDPANERELLAFARSRLSDHAVPRRILLVDRLPRNVAGKVLKADLRARVEAERTRPSVPPRTPTEESIASVWAGVLGRERVGVHDRFVDLGGQSLSAMLMVAAVEERLGIRLSAKDLDEADTVAALAELVDRRRRLRSAGADWVSSVPSVHANDFQFEWTSSPDAIGERREVHP